MERKLASNLQIWTWLQQFELNSSLGGILPIRHEKNPQRHRDDLGPGGTGQTRSNRQPPWRLAVRRRRPFQRDGLPGGNLPRGGATPGVGLAPAPDFEVLQLGRRGVRSYWVSGVGWRACAGPDGAGGGVFEHWRCRRWQLRHGGADLPVFNRRHFRLREDGFRSERQQRRRKPLRRHEGEASVFNTSRGAASPPVPVQERLSSVFHVCRRPGRGLQLFLRRWTAVVPRLPHARRHVLLDENVRRSRVRVSPNGCQVWRWPPAKTHWLAITSNGQFSLAQQSRTNHRRPYNDNAKS